MADITTSQKKDYAKILFTQMGLNQKESAKKAGVSTKTMCSWVDKGKWETLRASLAITKEAQLRLVYAQLNELQNVISKREEGKRYADTKEADSISKLASTIKTLESEAGLSETVDVMMNFLSWIRSSDLKKAQDFTPLIDAYIKSKLR